MDILAELLANVLSNYVPDKDNLNEFDLNNKEEYDAFVKAINDLRDDPLFSYIINPIADNVLKLAYEKYGKKFEQNDEKQLSKNKIQKDSSKIIRKEVDHSEEITEPDRPSNHVSVDQGLKIHKIVGEYVDTMIKPYYKGNNLLRNNPSIINDAYAGLYEFACWIMNR